MSRSISGRPASAAGDALIRGDCSASSGAVLAIDEQKLRAQQARSPRRRSRRRPPRPTMLPRFANTSTRMPSRVRASACAAPALRHRAAVGARRLAASPHRGLRPRASSCSMPPIGIDDQVSAVRDCLQRGRRDRSAWALPWPRPVWRRARWRRRALRQMAASAAGRAPSAPTAADHRRCSTACSGRLLMHRPRLAGERQQHVRLDVQQIVGSLPQARTSSSCSSAATARRMAPRQANPALLPAAMSSCAVSLNQGIVEKLQVRGDDLAARLPAGSRTRRSRRRTCRAPARVRRFRARLRTLLDDLDLAAVDAGRAAHRECRAPRQMPGSAPARWRVRAAAAAAALEAAAGAPSERCHAANPSRSASSMRHADRRDGLRRLRTAGLNQDLIAAAHAERHDRDDAARIGAAPVRAQFKFRGRMRLARCERIAAGRACSPWRSGICERLARGRFRRRGRRMRPRGTRHRPAVRSA